MQNLTPEREIMKAVRVHVCGGPEAMRYEEAPMPVRGQLTVPSKPGLGLEFDRAVLERYAVA